MKKAIYPGSFDCIFKTVFICTFSDRCVGRDWDWSNLWTACRRGISRGAEEKNEKLNQGRKRKEMK